MEIVYLTQEQKGLEMLNPSIMEHVENSGLFFGHENRG